MAGTRSIGTMGENPDFPDIEIFSVRQSQRATALQLAVNVAQISDTVTGETPTETVLNTAKEFFDFLAG